MIPIQQLGFLAGTVEESSIVLYTRTAVLNCNSLLLVQYISNKNKKYCICRINPTKDVAPS